jgi:hypothetical protein
MSVRLDWEIESDNTRVRSRGEDPEARRRRRAAYMRLLVTTVLVVLVLGGAVAFVVYRLELVNQEIENLLRDTVAAEVAALRIDSWNAFAQVQRSATDDWLQQQRATFDSYQELLRQDDSAQLTGHILDITIDGPRARVHVEEIIGGTSYTRVWFYWYYELDLDGDGELDGWRHVPPDYTFWGAAGVYEGASVKVDRREVDALLATSMGQRLDAWVQLACAALGCGDLPSIRVDIAPTDMPADMAWAADDPWRLQVLSPYTARARTDRPFTPDMQLQAASLLAERLVRHLSGDVRAVYPADAYYLQQAVKSWLVGEFAEINTNSFLIASLAENYGGEAVGALLQHLGTSSSIDVFREIVGTSLEHANLDWRDFFTWRLVLESELAISRDEEAFLSLYDTRDDAVRGAAYSRFEQGTPRDVAVTMVREAGAAADGSPQQVATVQIGSGETASEFQVLFRLVDGRWVRAS